MTAPDCTSFRALPWLCTDNAAMIAFAAALRFQAGCRLEVTEEIDPNLALVATFLWNVQVLSPIREPLSHVAQRRSYIALVFALEQVVASARRTIRVCAERSDRVRGRVW